MARRVGLAGFQGLPIDWLLRIHSQAQDHSGFPKLSNSNPGGLGQVHCGSECEILIRQVVEVYLVSSSRRGTDRTIAGISKLCQEEFRRE